MADNVKTAQTDPSAKPSVEKGTFVGVGTYAPLKNDQAQPRHGSDFKDVYKK